MNAEQIREIIREELQAALTAFFSGAPVAADPRRDPDYISPAREAQIRLLARQNMAAMAAKKQAKRGQA